MTPGLTIHRSNRLEALAERLGDLVAAPLPSPLQAETVVVQSLGMRRWLALGLAARLGISMNCRFPFPHTLAHEVFRAAFPEIPVNSAFSREALLWRIYSLLPKFAQEPAFAPLRNYVGSGETSGLKQFQLAGQAATLFDRLLVHRAGELLEWERGADGDWQPALWRALAAGYEGNHPPGLLERLLARIKTGETSLPTLPPRLSVFGISSLPPYYIDLLKAVARCVDLHLFLFEPTDQYWGDVQAPREQRRFLRRHGRPGQTAPDLHLEAGNALLASLGKPGRQFSNAVADLEPNCFDECFLPPARTSLLSRLQADLFELRDRPHGERERVADGDRSIQVHCCHGPMREVEVLYDHLLDLFQRRSELTPKDVVVMMPDVETYAPFIEAVFDAPEDEALRIPFTIADRKATSENAIARSFLEVLALHGSRFGAATVLRLLEREPVRKRFGLGEDDLRTVRGWVEETGIRWGIDAKHRSEFNLPAFAQNSWRAGLDRLLLGYALSGDGTQMFEDVLPSDGIEGGQAEILGKFADFTGKLFEIVPTLGASRALDEWEAALGRVLTTFVGEPEGSSDEIRRVRSVLETLGGFAKLHRGLVPFEVVASHLAKSFADTDSGRGFIVGHVTFCSLKPMRSIPFRVICMLGLNDTAFPRRDSEGALDVLAGAGQPGRSRRDEDRQVFLEAILSARETLYLSHSGLSTKDNSEAPPSVVVSELLDYLGANYEAPSKPLAEWILVKHRLQPFSRHYFSGADERLFSYSKENARAARNVEPRPGSASTLIDGPLPEPGPEWLTVEISVLQRFFRHPARYFLTERLDLRLPETEALAEETEPLELCALDQWRVQRELAGQLLAGADAEPTLRAIRSAGVLPLGYSGASALRDVHQAVQSLVQRMQTHSAGEALPPEPVSLEIGHWRLSGVLNGRFEAGLVRLTASKLPPRERLNAWIDHLVLCSIHAGAAPSTRLFATDVTLDLAFVPNARDRLEDLLSIYSTGLREPIPFFLKSSFEFARMTFQPGKARITPDAAARKLWEERERDEPHHELCFRECDPLDERWRELALRVWKPFFDHCQEVST